MRQRTGLLLMLVGLLMAGLATFLVMRIANQTAESTRSRFRQVQVLTATRDIGDQTVLTPQLVADAFVVKAMPVEFVPPNSLSSLDQVVDKFANGFIPRDQVVVAGQIAAAPRAPKLSERVPPGKVVTWLPMPQLLGAAQVLKVGDHVDILLTIGVPAEGTGPQDGVPKGGQTTQTTIQNVEVFRLGQEEVNLAAPPVDGRAEGRPAVPGQSGPIETGPPVQPTPGQGGSTPNAAAATQRGGGGAGVIGFLVDHQDALIIKHIKDSGGLIDIVVRSLEEQQVVRTDPVTLDVLVDRYRFRLVGPGLR
jgi:pilus assembly protein CpaB